MNVLDNLFATTAKQSKEVQRLLAFLKEYEPGACFSLLSNNGEESTSTEESSLPHDRLSLLANNAKTNNKLVSLQGTENTPIYALPVAELDAVLLFTLPENGSALGARCMEPSIIPVYVELFFTRKALAEEREYLTIEKKQIRRKINVMEERYLEILSDNYQQHQLIQEKQSDYSRTLKAEIARRTDELRKANAHLELNSRLQQKILDNAATAIYTVDTEQCITSVNEEFCSVTGFSQDEVLGKPCDILSTDVCMADCGLFSFGSSKRVIKQHCTILTKDRRRLSVIKNADTICDDSGRRIGGVESFVDVTELIKAREAAEVASRALEGKNQQLTQAMEHAKQMASEAKTASVAKSEFLAAMSHEIRTPMNAVIGFTDMLIDTRLDDEQIDYVKTIKISGEALLTLIDGILDFSKVEARQLSLECIDFDPEITAYDVCELIRPKMGSKRVEILHRIGNHVPAAVKGDPGRFRQVLINLMGNAAKFTEAGEIELSLDIEEKKDNQVKLHTTVRDTGMGIPEEKLALIFGAFQQADGSTTRQYGGTGLGLSICKKLAELMNGSVWAESELGKGSVFHFTAWMEKSECQQKRDAFPISLSGKRILVVDDNQSNLDIVSHILKSESIRTVALRKSEEALPTLSSALDAQDPFDLCILDIQMPGMFGYDVAKAIRGFEVAERIPHSERRNPQSAIRHLPLIALSSWTGKEARACLAAGFDGYLPKPAHRQKLLTMIEKLLGEKKDRDGKGQREAIVTQYSLRETAKREVSILLAEDHPFNQKLAKTLLTKAGYQVEVASTGKGAVNKYIGSPDDFDIIFMDVQMPEMEGLEATAEIRKWECGRRNGEESVSGNPKSQIQNPKPRTPIVAMTAQVMKGDREKCLEAGMDDYMAKPIRREPVFAMINKWVLR